MLITNKKYSQKLQSDFTNMPVNMGRKKKQQGLVLEMENTTSNLWKVHYELDEITLIINQNNQEIEQM